MLPRKQKIRRDVNGVRHVGHHRLYLTIIPLALMDSESIAHEAEGRMGY